MAEVMRWWTKPALAVAIYALVAVALAVAVYTKNDSIMNIIVGAIIAEFARASGYFFGSSDSSQKKDDTIATQSAALATSTPAHPERTNP